MRLSRHFSKRKTPQCTAVLDRNQVRSDAGGCVFATDRWALLERLLILGTEGGTYTASKQNLTRPDAQNLEQLIHDDGPKVVRTIVEISRGGRAPKNDAALFALALSAAIGNDLTKRLAREALPSVARSSADLFQFVTESESLRGWGRGLRRAVGNWYCNRDLDDLVYQVLKCRQRNGWTHADLLKLSHPAVEDEQLNDVFSWLLRGESSATHPRLEAFDRLQSVRYASDAAKLIRDFDLPQEAVPSAFLRSAEVWDALLDRMPISALLQNLETMTRVGLLAPFSEAEQRVNAVLTDERRLMASRVHPLSVLAAMESYEHGTELNSSKPWVPVGSVLSALDQAFRLVLRSVQPTGLRHLISLDVSASMGVESIAGMSLTPEHAALAMALIALESEDDVVPMAFCEKFRNVTLRPGMSLGEAFSATAGLTSGRTDCALPMIWARQNRIPIDVFVVYTDNKTWFGDIHPFQALLEYRQATGLSSKLILVGMTATRFSIADPSDTGMLDVVGFDSSVPQAMREFSLL